MAAVTVAEVRKGLPVGVGGAVTDPDVQGFIDDWTYRVTKKAGAEAANSPSGREAIRLGATAAAREIVDAVSGFAESPVSKSQRQAAKDILKELDDLNTAPDEGEPDAGDVDETLYAGPTPVPLWPVDAPYVPDAGTWVYPGRRDPSWPTSP